MMAPGTGLPAAARSLTFLTLAALVAAGGAGAATGTLPAPTGTLPAPAPVSALPVPASVLPAPSPERATEYNANVKKSVIALQQFRTSQRFAIIGPGGKPGTATLTSLNPNVRSWFLLTLNWANGRSVTYHLENSHPSQTDIVADPTLPGGLVVTDGTLRHDCLLWVNTPSALTRARASRLPYAPLCGGRFSLRNRVSGRQTNLELVTNILRKHVIGGEEIVGFVKRNFYADAFLDKADKANRADKANANPLAAALKRPAAQGPGAARISKAYAGRSFRAQNLGITISRPGSGGLELGRWYAARDLPGVWAGIMLPGAVSRDILDSSHKHVNRLDRVESGALVYLAAFDLGRFSLGWERGTIHPGVGWSPRPPYRVHPRGMPGPDGFNTITPLVTTGMLNPQLAGRVVATFTGGFKRSHGAWRFTDMALTEKGHHYGFVEHGVVLSKLVPGLATLYIMTDGRIHMKTWAKADNALLPQIVTARQNGVPLVEWNAATGRSEPGLYVNMWGRGNWSGSASAKLRTLRAGACLLDDGISRYLVYAYFSTATPSAMAQVFRAYGCKYAMLLDMNAPVLTYMATYTRKNGTVLVGHLVKVMAREDKRRGKSIIPRFLGFPDNRDFFYLLARKGTP